MCDCKTLGKVSAYPFILCTCHLVLSWPMSCKSRGFIKPFMLKFFYSTYPLAWHNAWCCSNSTDVHRLRKSGKNKAHVYTLRLVRDKTKRNERRCHCGNISTSLVSTLPNVTTNGWARTVISALDKCCCCAGFCTHKDVHKVEHLKAISPLRYVVAWRR